MCGIVKDRLHNEEAKMECLQLKKEKVKEPRRSRREIIMPGRNKRKILVSKTSKKVKRNCSTVIARLIYVLITKMTTQQHCLRGQSQ